MQRVAEAASAHGPLLIARFCPKSFDGSGLDPPSPAPEPLFMVDPSPNETDSTVGRGNRMLVPEHRGETFCHHPSVFFGRVGSDIRRNHRRIMPAPVPDQERSAPPFDST